MTDTSPGPGDVAGPSCHITIEGAIEEHVDRTSDVDSSTTDVSTAENSEKAEINRKDADKESKTCTVNRNAENEYAKDQESGPLFEANLDTCATPEDYDERKTSSALASLYPANPPKRAPKKTKAKSKRKKSIMRRMCIRIPKLICYMGIALLVVFSLKKLNELTNEVDNNTVTTDPNSGIEVTHIPTGQSEHSETIQIRSKSDIDTPVEENVKDRSEYDEDATTANSRQERDVESSEQNGYATERLRAKDVKDKVRKSTKPRDEEPQIMKKQNDEDFVRVQNKDDADNFHHDDDEIDDDENKLKVKRKFVEHIPPEDFRYRAQGNHGNELKARKEFHLKPIPRHMAEIVMEEPEPEDEADPAHAVFVTGASTESFNDVIQLVQSIQKYLPKSTTIIYDIGLQTHEKLILKSGCKVELRDVFLNVFPAHVRVIANKNWRPIVIQLALAEFHYIVWVDPAVRLNSGRIEPILKMATTSGVGILANPGAYSTFTVTNPAMYDFLPTSDLAKFKLEPHLEVKLMALHTSQDVQDRFMRWLTLCATENGCLAPKGASTKCVTPMRSQKYAKCHRYEESAINILLKNWFNHDAEKFYVRNVVAVPVLNKKVTPTLKQCPVRARDL